MQTLTLSYDPDDDCHGELTATVQSDGFAGTSSAWFSIEQLKAFGEALGPGSIEPGRELTLRGGHWKDGELIDAHLSIRVAPAGHRGRLRVEVLLVTQGGVGGEGTRNSVQTQFLVTYGDLDRFRPAFSALLKGEISEARLHVTPT